MSTTAAAGLVAPEVMHSHCEIEMQVPDTYVGVLIGKNGNSVTEIMNVSFIYFMQIRTFLLVFHSSYSFFFTYVYNVF